MAFIVLGVALWRATLVGAIKGWLSFPIIAFLEVAVGSVIAAIISWRFY